MGQDIVFGLCVGLAIFAIVGETIADKSPTKKFSKWWREKIVSKDQGKGQTGC
jgi:hypothetical protein